MEKFYDHLKDLFFVDTDNREINEISKAVDLLFHRYMDFMNTAYHGTQQIERLLSSGSMQEKTRIWQHLKETSRDPDIEFDYLAVLKDQSGEMKFERSCLGHMQLVSDTDVDTGKKCHKDLSAVIVEFWEIFVATVETQCGCFERGVQKCTPFAFTIDVIRNTQGCDVCTVSMETGTLRLSFLRPKIILSHMYPVHFEWQSTGVTMTSPRIGSDRNIYKQALETVIVHADFLPAYDVQLPNPPGIYVLGKRDIHSCFLVPKHCKQHEKCWRISYCLSEIEILQGTSQCHRDVYKLLKVIQSLFRTGLKSYHIKTVIIHHINSCNHAYKSRHHCLVATLDFLAEGMANRSMPHTIEGLNLRDVFSEHSLYLYHAQIFYIVLAFALGLCESEDDKRESKPYESVVVDAFVAEMGSDLLETAKRVRDGEELYRELVGEIFKLGEWVSKKRVNEYRQLQSEKCNIL